LGGNRRGGKKKELITGHGVSEEGAILFWGLEVGEGNWGPTLKWDNRTFRRVKQKRREDV